MKYPIRFLMIICTAAILSSAFIGGLSYWFQKQHSIKEAKTKSNLLIDYINTSATYFESSQKPLVNELLRNHNRFYPELTNGFMVLREYSDILQEKNNGQSFRLASLNPLNEKNRAVPFEKQIIEKFRSNPLLKKQDGLVSKNGSISYFSSSPLKVRNNYCLVCHGKPEDAPRAQIIMYGMDNGYEWKKDETIATTIVYISLQQAIQDAKVTATKIFFMSFACFLLTFLVISLF